MGNTSRDKTKKNIINRQGSNAHRMKLTQVKTIQHVKETQPWNDQCQNHHWGL